jgi:adenylosuccinate synthase
VTRSNLLPTFEYPKINEIYLVTRAYQTRHGNGPMTNEGISHNIKDDPQETNVSGYQGEFRKALLDLDLITYAIFKSKILKIFSESTINLVITCLDHIEKNYQFTKDGQMYSFPNEKDFVRSISGVLGINNIWVSHSPYSENIQKFEL